MCVSSITQMLYIPVDHILCQYKSSFSCHTNELICILLHMRMNVIYEICTWSNIKVEIAQISLRSVFYCSIQMKSMSFHNIEVQNYMGFHLDKATIICIKNDFIKRLHT